MVINKNIEVKKQQINSFCPFCGAERIGCSNEHCLSFACGTESRFVASGGLFSNEEIVSWLSKHLKRHITCYERQLTRQSDLIRKTVETINKALDQAEMPYRCRCQEMATLQTNHGKDCAVTLFQTLLPELEAVIKKKK